MTSEEPLNRGLIVIPGLNSDTYESPFEEVIEYAKRMEFSVVRLDGEINVEDFEHKTLMDMHDLMDRAVEALEDHGCNQISVLGESFGGQLALTYPKNQLFEFMVLWRPMIGLGQDNIEKWSSKPLGQVDTPLDICISNEKLSNLSVPVKVIHGTEDEVVSIDNSRNLVEALPRAKLAEIDNVSSLLDSKKVISVTEGMLLSSKM